MSVRVLMLGWEFPPFITGGLGTACYGLTKAMDRAGMKVTFVLPKVVEMATQSSHVELISPGREMGEPINDFTNPSPNTLDPAPPLTRKRREALVHQLREAYRSVHFVDLPISVDSVYSKSLIWQKALEEGINERRLP
ncbi:MAG: glycogen/starch synthase, partial [Phycisphaerales bacterium]|nr:glycogen/starch synthase [Phycisphaerales bacterium]